MAEGNAERLSDVQIVTLNSKVSRNNRVSRIRGRTHPRILFPSHVRGQQNKKWSEAEKCALVRFVQHESGGKITHKQMEYWSRAATFVQQESKNVHQCKGKYCSN